MKPDNKPSPHSSPSPPQLHYVTNQDLRFFVHDILAMVVIEMVVLSDAYSCRD